MSINLYNLSLSFIHFMSVGINSLSHSHNSTACNCKSQQTVGPLSSKIPVFIKSHNKIGVKTLRTQDTSDLRHFGTTVMVPKCPDISALVPKCLMDTSAPVPKCPDTSAPSQYCLFTKRKLHTHY